LSVLVAPFAIPTEAIELPFARHECGDNRRRDEEDQEGKRDDKNCGNPRYRDKNPQCASIFYFILPAIRASIRFVHERDLFFVSATALSFCSMSSIVSMNSFG
jgi:hypothetical protein